MLHREENSTAQVGVGKRFLQGKFNYTGGLVIVAPLSYSSEYMLHEEILGATWITWLNHS